MPELSGFLNIDKPLGMTSHDVVDRVRRILHMKKVGHAGTLDPLATGVLVLCLGSATRLSDYVMDSTKRYEARVTLGRTTTTYDAEGETVEERDPTGITRADVEAVLPHFTGAISQLPPMYSAVKQDGKKLYELARAGQTVERNPRHITIQTLEITDWSSPDFTLVVTCSAGTYIRSLAFDLGEALGVGAYLSGLVRAASGRFTLDNAVTLDALAASDNPSALLITPQQALADRLTVALDDQQRVDITHGRAVQGAAADDGTLAFAYNPDGSLLAVLRAADGAWKPQKVFTDAGTR